MLYFRNWSADARKVQYSWFALSLYKENSEPSQRSLLSHSFPRKQPAQKAQPSPNTSSVQSSTELKTAGMLKEKIKWEFILHFPEIIATFKENYKLKVSTALSVGKNRSDLWCRLDSGLC